MCSIIVILCTGVDCASTKRGPVAWELSLDAETLNMPRTRLCFEHIEANQQLGYDLPKRPGLNPGQVLKHCFAALDRILEKQKPCIYKVGYTHDAYWRFFNDLYGYSREVAKWERMVVIYAASECISPGFVEAALIQQHKGPLKINGKRTRFGLYSLLYRMHPVFCLCFPYISI